MQIIPDNYYDIRDTITDGDVLLFSRKNTFISNLISRVQGNRHTHVALAKWDGLRLKTREFREFEGYDERFVSDLGPFDLVSTGFAWGPETDEFIRAAKDQPYSYFKALIAALPIPFFGGGYICSEFVADALQGQINLPPNPTPGDLSLWFWENDFPITKVKYSFDSADEAYEHRTYLLSAVSPGLPAVLKGMDMPNKFKQIHDYEKPNRHIDTVYLHCSDSDNPDHDNPETMDRWHKERGWAGIGYHVYLAKDGNFYQGRDFEKIPAAQRPFNRRTFAICTGGRSVTKFTPQQFESLRRFCGQIDAAHGGEMVFKGHCEVSPKTCPVFDYKQVLRMDKNGRIKDGVPTIKKLEASKSQHMKAAKKQQGDGDLTVGIGTVTVGKGIYESVKDVQPLEALKELTSKGLEYKSVLIKVNELAAWLITVEGMVTAGGAVIVFWGWRMMKSANSLKQARLKEEPKLKRLAREASEVV